MILKCKPFLVDERQPWRRKAGVARRLERRPGQRGRSRKPRGAGDPGTARALLEAQAGHGPAFTHRRSSRVRPRCCTPSSAASRPRARQPRSGATSSCEALAVSRRPTRRRFTLTVVEGGPQVTEPSGTCDTDGGDSGLASEDFDAWDAGPCTTPLAPGDLMMDEVMVSTVPGSADRGQWLEVRNTRRCSVDLDRARSRAGADGERRFIRCDVERPRRRGSRRGALLRDRRLARPHEEQTIASSGPVLPITWARRRREDSPTST